MSPTTTTAHANPTAMRIAAQKEIAAKALIYAAAAHVTATAAHKPYAPDLPRIAPTH